MKKEEIKNIVENKKELIEFKKSTIKFADVSMLIKHFQLLRTKTPIL
jgi:hypothetical protein